MSMRTVVPEPENPVIKKHKEMRKASLQNRVADAVTTFAGLRAHRLVQPVDRPAR